MKSLPRWISPTSRCCVARLLVAWLVTFVFSASTAVAEPARWRADIDKILARDAANPPAEGGIVFVGSSSITGWSTLKKDFPGLNVINHGFGGSQLEDSVFYFDELVAARKPRAVVLYAGENDLSAGATPEKVAEDFAAFRAKLHAALPQARLIYIGCKPSPSRMQHWEKFQAANALIAAACAQDARCTYVDMSPGMLNEQRQPREELFRPDRLHLNAEGYAIWVRLLAPHLGS